MSAIAASPRTPIVTTITPILSGPTNPPAIGTIAPCHPSGAAHEPDVEEKGACCHCLNFSCFLNFVNQVTGTVNSATLIC